jgi:hypothetical protein
VFGLRTVGRHGLCRRRRARCAGERVGGREAREQARAAEPVAAACQLLTYTRTHTHMYTNIYTHIIYMYVAVNRTHAQRYTNETHTRAHSQRHAEPCVHARTRAHLDRASIRGKKSHIGVYLYIYIQYIYMWICTYKPIDIDNPESMRKETPTIDACVYICTYL